MVASVSGGVAGIKYKGGRGKAGLSTTDGRSGGPWVSQFRLGAQEVQ